MIESYAIEPQINMLTAVLAFEEVRKRLDEKRIDEKSGGLHPARLEE